MTEQEQKAFDLMREALEGIAHFSDAVDFHSDPLSRAMSQWINAGRQALIVADEAKPK